MPTRSLSAKARTVRGWCRQCLPPIFLARCLLSSASRPIDWLFLAVGCAILLRSSAAATLFFAGDDDDDDPPPPPRGGEKKTASRGAVDRSDGRDAPGSDDGVEREGGGGAGGTARRRPPPRSDADDRTSLTTLPSVVLSNVACCLHPRDVLVLDTVLRCAVDTRRDGDDGRGDDNDSWKIRMQRVDNDSDAVLSEVWKRLCYRDFGDVLLRWKVSREAFRRSLNELSSPSTWEIRDDVGGSDDHNHNKSLDEQLSDRLDDMSTSSTAMKDFYFTFGQCYIDYVLAQKNTIEECYLGLHGHIFDFTDFAEYHPGLIEPILKECGGDATHFFEDVPHSSVARNVARRLCVVVDRGVLGDAGCCGLELVANDDVPGRKRALRSSNTRPLPPPTRSGRNGDGRVDEKDVMSHVIPHTRGVARRGPTLERIRARFGGRFPCRRSPRTDECSNPSLATIISERMHLQRFWNQPPSGVQKSLESRSYYDPLQEKWIRWRP